VQNRVSRAEPRLPEEVKRQGINVKKRSSETLLFISFYSPDGLYDDLFLSNFVSMRVKDEVARVNGVGDVMAFGAGDYSMRIWLDPEKLKARRLTAGDVVQALREQNVQVAAGKIGARPVPEGQAFEYVVNTRGRLVEPAEFEQVILRAE
ncbi:MAG: hydrophobe/amphiphile efflux-1 family RND transporter, partial [Gammaproteobacteria bacterium]|nr:hydrophobe/amphiphile efflux-1 family RND transporter [Gammaproteobacteria bacterium]